MQCHVCVHRPTCCATLKNVTTPPPPPNPYISEMAFSCRFQKVYTYPPPLPGLHMEAKVVENAEKCQNPESWHVLNVPERYCILDLKNCNHKDIRQRESSCLDNAVLAQGGGGGFQTHAPVPFSWNETLGGGCSAVQRMGCSLCIGCVRILF